MPFKVDYKQFFLLTQNVLCNPVCSDYTWIVYLVCIWSSSVTPEMELLSPLYLNQNELILGGMYVN